MIAIEEIHRIAMRVEPVGSRITCNPPPMDTDEDFLVLVSPVDWAKFECAVFQYEAGGSDIPDDVNHVPHDDRFRSYRHDETNLIVTRSDVFFRRFMAATAVAKRLNLLDKADRICVFQAVLYGNGGLEAEIAPPAPLHIEEECPF